MAKYALTQKLKTKRTVIIEAASEAEALAIFRKGEVVSTNKGLYLSFDGSGFGDGAWFEEDEEELIDFRIEKAPDDAGSTLTIEEVLRSVAAPGTA